MMDAAAQNALALRLKHLHNPGTPLIIANVYDAASAAVVLAHPNCRAVATASYAIAATQGVEDDLMTLAQNLTGLRNVAAAVAAAGWSVPLSVDLQDGYDDVGASVRHAIALGAVGCNIEDVESRTQRLRGIDENVRRIQAVLAAARDVGVPDFVVNARTDVMGFEGAVLDDAIERGRAYLAAGATCVFAWGGNKGRGLRDAEVQKLCEALGGRLSVFLKMPPGTGLTVKELGEIGVARISVGPGLQREAMKGLKSAADALLGT